MLNKIPKFVLSLCLIVCFISIIIGSYIQRAGLRGYGRYLIIFSVSFVILLITTIIWNIKKNKDRGKDKEF